MFIFRCFGFLRATMWPTADSWEQDCRRDGRHRWGMALAGGYTCESPESGAYRPSPVSSVSFSICVCFSLVLVYQADLLRRGICLWCWGDSLFLSSGPPESSYSYLWRLHHHTELGPISCSLLPKVRTSPQPKISRWTPSLAPIQRPLLHLI